MAVRLRPAAPHAPFQLIDSAVVAPPVICNATGVVGVWSARPHARGRPGRSPKQIESGVWLSATGRLPFLYSSNEGVMGPQSGYRQFGRPTRFVMRVRFME